MTYPCRCRLCGRRRTLAKHPDEYYRHQRCGCRRDRAAIRVACDNGLEYVSYRVDKYRCTGRENPPSKTCYCNYYSFPHHIGRGWCSENLSLTADDLRRREEELSYA